MAQPSVNRKGLASPTQTESKRSILYTRMTFSLEYPVIDLGQKIGLGQAASRPHLPGLQAPPCCRLAVTWQ